jgi:agmatine deiminase
VPTYGARADHLTVTAFESWFPRRKIVGVPCKAVVVGGGGFHCCTQQQPALPSAS